MDYARHSTLVMATIVLVEVFGYLWHRFAAHSELLGVETTHDTHHQASMAHQADEDFIWLMCLIVAFEVAMIHLLQMGRWTRELGLITATVVLIFYWNWWLHACFHDESHWLNNFSWFQRERERHLVHHQEPDKNFSIASHFMDRWGGTWQAPA